MSILQICINTRNENGGLIDIQEVKRILNQNKNRSEKVKRGDIRIAVSKLSCLSNSLCITKCLDEDDKEVEYIKSSDMEFSPDSMRLLAKANRQGGEIKPSDMISGNVDKWRKELDTFVNKGIAWIDVHENVTTYYFPSIYFNQTN